MLNILRGFYVFFMVFFLDHLNYSPNNNIVIVWT